MSAFWSSIAADLVASLIFWFGLGLAAAQWARYTRRRFTLMFGSGNLEINVLLSNSAEPGANSSVSMNEIGGYRSLARLFDSTRGRLPELVSGLVDTAFLPSRFVLDVQASPEEVHAAPSTPRIVLGGAARNHVRRYYIETQQVTFETNVERQLPRPDVDLLHGAHIVATRGSRQGERYGEGRNCAVIEKFIDGRIHKPVICIAGHRSDSTRFACEYFVRHWPDLVKEFGSRPFVIVLEFPVSSLAPHMTHYVEPATPIREAF